jgi:hypothetical protein
VLEERTAAPAATALAAIPVEAPPEPPPRRMWSAWSSMDEGLGCTGGAVGLDEKGAFPVLAQAIAPAKVAAARPREERPTSLEAMKRRRAEHWARQGAAELAGAARCHVPRPLPLPQLLGPGSKASSWRTRWTVAARIH